MRGNFDMIIKQQLARGKDDNMFKRLKKHEKSMEQSPDAKPNVLMEDDKSERDYPSTHEYNYTRDPNEPPRVPRKNKPEFIRRPKQRAYRR